MAYAVPRGLRPAVLNVRFVNLPLQPPIPRMRPPSTRIMLLVMAPASYRPAERRQCKRQPGHAHPALGEIVDVPGLATSASS